MKVLELFAGSCSFSKAAKALGHEVFATDLSYYDGIDLQVDILDLDVRDIPFKPDVIWASPPCQTFSVAAIGHHWKGGKNAYIPKTYKGYVGMAMVQKAIDIIEYYGPDKWYIENPRGVLRKLPIMDGLDRKTVTYCSYGDDRMKPTDIWTNDISWNPRKMCKNGNRDCHHEPAPRGSKTGTQGKKNAYFRSMVPQGLCYEILNN